MTKMSYVLLIALVIGSFAMAGCSSCPNPCNEPNPCDPCPNPCNEPNPCNPCDDPCAPAPCAAPCAPAPQPCAAPR